MIKYYKYDLVGILAVTLVSCGDANLNQSVEHSGVSTTQNNNKEDEILKSIEV